MGSLANTTVNRSDLSTIDSVNEVKAKATKLENFPTENFSINFSDKKSGRFCKYIESLYKANGERVYLWTSKSNDCGLYSVGCIKDVDFSFPFELNTEGMLVLLSLDINDKLLLDFYIDSCGSKVIDIEAQGLNWTNIKY